MTKPEILDVVKLMLQDWETSFQSKDSFLVEKNNCEIGFCLWLSFSCPFYFKHYVLRELSIDKIDFSFTSFWYPIFSCNQNFKNLLPRIEHLKRTIARLEKEISDDKNKKK